MPAISIIIPYYKAKKYFKDCLESVLYQTFQDFEIIVVIDGPHAQEDLPFEEIKTYNDNRIKVIEHEVNKGLAATRNTGIKSAVAEWVICLDADDMLPIDILEYYANLIQKVSAYDFFYGNSYMFGTENKVNAFIPFDVYRLIKLKCPGGAGVLIKKEIFDIVNYDESAVLRQGNEDYEYWINVLKHKYKGCYLPIITYLYRRYETSMVTNLMKNVHETTEYIAFKHRDFLSEHALFEDVRILGYLTASKHYYSNNDLKEAIKFCKIALSIEPLNMQAISLLNKYSKLKLKRMLKLKK